MRFYNAEVSRRDEGSSGMLPNNNKLSAQREATLATWAVLLGFIIKICELSIKNGFEVARRMERRAGEEKSHFISLESALIFQVLYRPNSYPCV